MTVTDFASRLRALLFFGLLLLPATTRAQDGVTFTFDHVVVSGSTLAFDVMVAGDGATRLGDTQVFFDYNALGFGLNVAAHDAIAARPGPAFYTSGYYDDPIAVDVAPSKLGLSMDFVGAPEDGVLLTETPTPLVHVEMAISNPIQSAGLALDPLLMAGLQETAAGLVFDLIDATDDDDTSLAEDGTGIEFTFAHSVVDGATLSFDVMVQATADGTRLGDTQVYLDYNELGFGSNVAAAGRITATLGADFAANGTYASPLVNDNTSSKVSIATELLGDEGDGVPLPTTPLVLLHVEMQIADASESSGLGFDEALMDGQQFHDDHATVYDPVVAADVKDTSLEEPPTGLIFTFANCVVADGKLAFDVKVRAAKEGTRLGDTQVYLTYDPDAFGQNVAASGAITVTRGAALANSNYTTPFVQDNTSSKVSIAVEFVGDPDDGVPVPTTPMQLLHVELTIADANHTAEIGFDEALMQGQQFESDNQTAYDPVTASDTKDPALKEPIGITFTLGNCDVTADGLEFDVFVAGEKPGTRLGDTQVYLTYNPDAFGSAVASMGSISVSLTGAFAGHPNYAVVNVVDNAADRVAITVDFDGPQEDGVSLPDTDVALLHVVIQVQDEDQTAGLGFEEALMQEQQFESNEEIAYNPVVAEDAKDPILREHFAIAFTFADCDVTVNGLEFDVRVNADLAGSRLGDVQIYLNYNADGFGPNVATNGRISVSLAGDFAADGRYSIVNVVDNTSSRVSIAVDYDGPEQGGVPLPDTPIPLLHVVIQVQNPNETAGLSFEQPLMEGQQFETDEATQYDPVVAEDTKDDPLNAPAIGLTFTFANCTVENGVFAFDVLVQADEDGTRLGDTQVYLDYEPDAFGENVNENGRISAALGPAFADNGNYAAPVLNDNMASKASIAVEFTGADPSSGESLSTTPVVLLHVELTIADASQRSGLNFDEALMDGQQFQSNNQTAYDPVRADDASCDVDLGGEPPEPVGIHFSFQDCRVEGGQYLFDVMVQADEDGTKLGKTKVYLKYNPGGFGEYVVDAGGVDVTLGSMLAANDNYKTVTNDNTRSRFSVATRFNSEDVADGLDVPTSPIVLFHVTMEIADDSETSRIAFKGMRMEGRQFESDNETAYDPVTVDNTGCDLPLEGDGSGGGGDDDEDGIPNGADYCPGTVIPESVPTVGFSTNRWALADADHVFDTKPPNGKGPKRHYTTEDTGGCSCEQIIEELDLGKGHRKHGCSNSAMDDWVAIVSSGSSQARMVSAAPETAAGPAPEPAEAAERFVLEPAYPNPFNPQTAFRFALREAEPVQVMLFNTLGQRVRVLYDGTPPAGQMQTVRIDGAGLPSGTYFIQVFGRTFAEMQTVVLVK